MAYRGIKLASSVICMDWFRLEESLRDMQGFGVDYLHYDVADSYFVPQFGLPFSIIKEVVNWCGLPSVYNLMVEEPKRLFDQIPLQDGAVVGVYYETCRNLHRDLVALRKLGFNPNLIMNPATGLEHIEYIVEEVNAVTIMTTNLGSSSQAVIPQTATKIGQLHNWREKVGIDLNIIVDGNLSFDTVPMLVAAGADVLVLRTQSVFAPGLESLAQGFLRLQEAIDNGIELAGEKER